jgi:hypothetical protein
VNIAKCRVKARVRAPGGRGEGRANRQAIKLIQACESISKIINERIEVDKKRYWRMACIKEENLFLLYIDNLKLVVDKAMHLLKNMNEDSLAALAIVPIIYVSSGTKS